MKILRDPKRLLSVALLVVALAGGSAAAHRSPDPSIRSLTAARQLPDLVPLPPDDVVIAASERDPDRPALRFASSTANRGEWPLDLVSTGTTDDDGRGIVRQCISWSAPHVCSERKRAGVFVYHGAHDHFHLARFARYELRRMSPSGAIDLTPGGLVAGGQKVSFCLIDESPDELGRHPFYAAPNPLYASCSRRDGTQGLSPGWKDTYDRDVAGQEIPLRGIPDGYYAVVVTLDPDRNLYQSQVRNDLAATGVRLSDRADSVEVLCTTSQPARGCRP